MARPRASGHGAPLADEGGIDWDRPIPATWALVAALIAAWIAGGLFQWAVGYEQLHHALLWPRSARFRAAVGAEVTTLVLGGEVWRLATATFSHADPLHLSFNATSIAVLGRILEPWVGAARVLGWFFAGALAGALVTLVARLHFSDGASGGAYALFGALVVVAWRRRGRLSADERRGLGPVLWVFLAANVALSVALPFVNAPGHMGGLAVGLVAGAGRAPTRAGTIGWGLVSAASVGAVAIGAFLLAR